MSVAFLTGATGFIGGGVARTLVERGWSVRALVRDGADLRNIEDIESSAVTGKIERVRGGLGDRQALEDGLAGCDALFHVAARYSLWNPHPAEIYRDNVDGTRQILELALEAGVERVVYTSTVGTIHIPSGGGSGSEARPARLEELRGHYKRSKWLAEAEVRRLAEKGLPVTIVHPSAPVGPFDIKPTPTGQMIVDFLKGKVKAYTHTGLNIVGVEDVAEGHLLAAEKGKVGESYILGGENMSLREIFAALSEVTAIPCPRVRIPTSALVPISLAGELFSRISKKPPLVPWESLAMAFKLMYFDSSKAIRELGYAPGSGRDALRRAVEWFYKHGYATPRNGTGGA